MTFVVVAVPLVFAGYIYLGQDTCERVQRAVQPLQWFAQLSEHALGHDHGWKQFQLTAFEATWSVVGDKKEVCPHLQAMRSEQVQRAIQTREISEDERRALLGR